MICEDCGVAGGWSPDGRYLIGHSVDGRLYMVEVASRRRIDLVALGPRWFCCGDISPDGRWISFFEGLRTHVAPFQGETPPPESSWVSGSGLWGFSPDWTLAYSFYDHDGFKCIGAQRLDRATMRPVGARLPVFHAHPDGRMVAWSVGRGRLLLRMAERTGNIWMAEWKRGW
jgi:hypothetical protein